MRSRIIIATTALAAVVALSACSASSPAQVSGSTATPLVPTKPVCDGDVVVVDFYELPDCDVVPPQRLDVVMSSYTVDPALECDRMSGALRPITDGPLSGGWVCEGVDY